MFSQYCRLGLHVGASNRALVRAAHGMLKPTTPAAARLLRDARHAWLRSAIAMHDDARAEYVAVVSGRVGAMRRASRRGQRITRA